MRAVHVTLEPNEENTSAFAVTLYFRPPVRGREVEQFLQTEKLDLPLSVDTSDPYFEVVKTRRQPFDSDLVRFQAHPTG